jgi:N-methylhydantoinase A
MAPSTTPDVTGRGRPRTAGEARKGLRRAFIPESGGLIECPVYDRYALGPDATLEGPALVEERETTVLLLPGDRARVDEYFNLLVDVAGPEGNR